MSRFGNFGGACVAAMTVVALGCSDGGVTVNNTNPLGTVGGLLTDVVAQMPLDGVAVKLLSAGGTFDTTTGADGFYKLENVPSGSYTLQFSKDGYLGFRVTGNLSGSVGNFPISMPINTQIPYAMVPTGPDLVVRLVDANGVAVNGATASARLGFSFADMSNGTPQFEGTTLSTATTAADGRLVFKGLPDVVKLGSLGFSFCDAFGCYSGDTALVTIAPIQVTGQDNYQYYGGVFPIRLLVVNQTVQQIVLPGPNGPLGVLETNLEWLRDGFTAPTVLAPIAGSVIDTAGPITIAFSEAVDPATLRATVTLENGGPGPAVTPTVNLNLVSLAGAFTAGTRYNLYLEATAALNGAGPNRQKNAYVPFFGKPASGTKPTVVSAKLGTGVGTPPYYPLTITLSEPIGVGDGATQAFDCVLFFEGVNLDGSAAGMFNIAGEWSTDPTQLSCATASQQAGQQPNALALNNSHVGGIENEGNLMVTPPITGYVTKFTTTVGQYVQTAAMTMAAPGSASPIAGTKGHLYFTNSAKTIRRANGEPVGEIPFTLQ